MSERITLARPYAEAAFGCAQAAKLSDSWLQALNIAAAVAADERVAALMTDPRVARERLTALFVDLGPAGSTRFRGEFGNFIHVLAENHRLPLLPEIARLFALLKAEAERVV